MGQCTNNSCSTHSGSDHSSKSSCGCSSGCGCGCGCGCSSQKCGCSCHQGKYSEELFSLADQAWMELLKEKIKAEILSASGDQLTQLAKLVATANHGRWKDKMAGKRNCENFESQLKSIMNGSNK